jgi:hypothetical protein
LNGPELDGDDFSEMDSEPNDKPKRKPGRPREVEPEALRRTVIELQFVLEQNWGMVGWLLWEAKSRPDVRRAFASIVNQKCKYLEPFREHPTRETTIQELRSLRKRVAEAQEGHRRNYARCQHAQETCKRTIDASSAECDPVRRAEIQRFRPDLARKYEEAESLVQSSNVELESLQTQLKEQEAYFAQTEILRFLESSRRKFTPRNVALGMAGLPRVTARVSCEQCGKFGINPPDGMAFSIFRTIGRSFPEPIRDLGHSIDTLRERLLYGPRNDQAQAAQLRKHWYFLESAIRSAARVTGAPSGSLTFRIFAEYSRTSTSYGAVEAVLAEANQLLKDNEDPN